MKQMTFADAEYAGKRKQTRKELFLIEMDRVVPWKGLITLIEPHYPKGDGGRPAYPLMAMLRVHLMQNWFGYSDPAMEEALYETTILRQFAGLSLERIPDETTTLNFRRLLEKHELAVGILAVINGYLGDRGLSLRQGTIVDATLINAPSSTKNKDGKRDLSIKKVEVLDVLDQTAVAKVTAQWGIDYLQLAKYDGQWKIINIIWQTHPTAR